MLVEMENCRVLVSDQKLEQMKDIIPVLEQITRQNQPLLIVTEDITGIHSTHLRQTLRTLHLLGCKHMAAGCALSQSCFPVVPAVKPIHYCEMRTLRRLKVINRVHWLQVCLHSFLQTKIMHRVKHSCAPA